MLNTEHSLLVIGLGMIGGSVLLSAREAGSAGRVMAYDRDEATLQAAASVLDNDAGSLPRLAAQASLIVIAVPPMAFAEVFQTLAESALRDDVVITDVGSVKAPVIEACRKQAPELMRRFIPAHPIAGSEQSGFKASRVGLFANKKLIVTPHGDMDDDVEPRGRAFWASLDCLLASLDPVLHDDLLASTSHLPHVLAYVLVDSLLRHRHIDKLFEFAAGGFQDISRTASSDPTMWHDVFISNKQNVLHAIEQFEQRLALFKELVSEERSEELHSMLSHAKRGRDDYLARYKG